MTRHPGVSTVDVELSDEREPTSSGLGRLCRCGCGGAIGDGSRPTKRYLNRWHKDRHRSRKERAAQRALGEIGDLKALWEAWGRQMGWME